MDPLFFLRITELCNEPKDRNIAILGLNLNKAGRDVLVEEIRKYFPNSQAWDESNFEAFEASRDNFFSQGPPKGYTVIEPGGIRIFPPDRTPPDRRVFTKTLDFFPINIELIASQGAPPEKLEELEIEVAKSKVQYKNLLVPPDEIDGKLANGAGSPEEALRLAYSIALHTAELIGQNELGSSHAISNGTADHNNQVGGPSDRRIRHDAGQTKTFSESENIIVRQDRDKQDVHIPPRALTAYYQFQTAARMIDPDNTKKLTDEDVYTALEKIRDEHPDTFRERFGKLPSFPSWARYLREYRKAKGEQKKKKGLNIEGRSIVKSKDIEPRKNDEWEL